MPGAAANLGVRDQFDPAYKVRGGGQCLQAMLAPYRYVRLALANYNAGTGQVDRSRAVPANAETKAYVLDESECILTPIADR